MPLEKQPVIVVIPVYEDAEAVSRLFRDLGALFAHEIFVVVVDDGSLTRPVELTSLETAGLQGVLITLRRNVGHQRAIAVGLGYVAENIEAHQQVVVMDSDGEDPPQSIPALLQGLESENVDVVVAQRTTRYASLWFKGFYVLYRLIFRVMTGWSLAFGNFMAMKAHAVRRLVSMHELTIHVAGAVLASRLRVGLCPLDRGRRYAGRSKMNFVGLALHGFKALMVFAEDMLVRVGIACSVVALLSVLGLVTALGLKTLGFATPGWFSVASGILLLIFMQTGVVALMTLMLTGVVRGTGAASALDYRDSVDQILHTSKGSKKP